jgi:hypothetical protein
MTGFEILAVFGFFLQNERIIGKVLSSLDEQVTTYVIIRLDSVHYEGKVISRWNLKSYHILYICVYFYFPVPSRA